MQSGLVYPVASVEATQFTEALAQNAVSAIYSLPMSPSLRNRVCLIRAISVVTKEDFAPELNFFAKAAGINADPALDCFISRYGFAAADGVQFGGAGVWRFYKDNLAIPYQDLDAVSIPSTLHVALANRSATAKSADAAGYLVATIWLEPLREG